MKFTHHLEGGRVKVRVSVGFHSQHWKYVDACETQTKETRWFFTIFTQYISTGIRVASRI